jgi:hypothetical protein
VALISDEKFAGLVIGSSVGQRDLEALQAQAGAAGNQCRGEPAYSLKLETAASEACRWAMGVFAPLRPAVAWRNAILKYGAAQYRRQRCFKGKLLGGGKARTSWPAWNHWF